MDLSNLTIKHKSNYIVFVPNSLKSKKPHKYTAWVIREKDRKLLHKVKFGNKNYEHYEDSTPTKFWSHLNHGDKKRRSNYRTRHEAILNKKGEQVYKVEYTPAWFSYNYLW